MGKIFPAGLLTTMEPASSMADPQTTLCQSFLRLLFENVSGNAPGATLLWREIADYRQRHRQRHSCKQQRNSVEIPKLITGH